MSQTIAHPSYPALRDSAPASENCLATGTRLAEFEIQGVVGEGGFGIVYLAFDHSLQRTVAIKEYMPAVLAGRGADTSVAVRSRQNQGTFEKGLRSFINEARLLAQFDHPALIKVYRFWEQNNTAYMVMRYYEGRTLKAIVSDNPELVTEAWLKSMLAPLLEALETLYRAKVLHRDISPDNIMIQPDGQAVLLDFGAARQIISDITQSLTVILKPGYAPVEQYADDDMMVQGPWTDIYSLSAVLYLLITRKPPPASVGRMIKDPIEILGNSERPGFDKPFLAAIDKGLAIRPEDRPQSVEAFRTLLGLGSGIATQSATAGIAPPIRVSTMPEPTQVSDALSEHMPHAAPKPEKSAVRSKWFGAAGAILLATIAIAVVAMKDGPQAETSAVETSIPTSLSPASIADEETTAWSRIDGNAKSTREDLVVFLSKYPDGKYTAPARFRLETLQDQSALSEAMTTPAASETDSTKEAVASPANPTLGTVKLMIKPWGNISVDGVAKGPSPPLKRLSLPEGKHQVVIENPAFPSRTVDIQVVGKKQISIEHSFSAPKP
ncbi:serine/threonine protein kinase [Herbaspirillum sp. GCM10030257]|uniref:serine/threonine protein kinase n=1 Tax=Herbaspirillum sp. GCM10030257 TaxID=3273393 RepID=UPI003608AEFB